MADIQAQVPHEWSPVLYPHVRPCQFSLEPLTYYHHPLLVHGLFHGRDLWFSITQLWGRGFCRKTWNGVTYWYRASPSQNRYKEDPLLIFHGICSGWVSYAILIDILGRDRPILLYDNKSIQHYSITFIEENVHGLCENVRGIFKQENIERAVVLGHSWGSFLAGWVIRLAPDLVSHLILVDPVCITIFLPVSVYRIVYKPPATVDEWLLEYFVRGDLAITHAVKRQFTWYNSALLLEEIPENVPTTFVLSSEDILIPVEIATAMTRAFCQTRENAQVLVWPGKGHAEGTNDRVCVEELRQYLLFNDGDAIKAVE